MLFIPNSFADAICMNHDPEEDYNILGVVAADIAKWSLLECCRYLSKDPISNMEAKHETLAIVCIAMDLQNN